VAGQPFFFYTSHVKLHRIEYLVFLFFFSPGLFLDVTHAWVSVYLYGNGREQNIVHRTEGPFGILGRPSCSCAIGCIGWLSISQIFYLMYNLINWTSFQFSWDGAIRLILGMNTKTRSIIGAAGSDVLVCFLHLITIIAIIIAVYLERMQMPILNIGLTYGSTGPA
jgi:hypothetical protein